MIRAVDGWKGEGLKEKKRKGHGKAPAPGETKGTWNPQSIRVFHFVTLRGKKKAQRKKGETRLFAVNRFQRR